MKTGSLRFVYRAIVYHWPDDTPEVCYDESLCDSFQYPLSENYEEIRDAFDMEKLETGKMYTVWMEGQVCFYSYDGPEGQDYDVEVEVEKQVWDEASEGDIRMLTAPDVGPVMIFYSASPVPDPNWERHGSAKPIGSPEDAPPTHHLWHRVDDDKRTVYQFSKVEDKIPTLMDGAYYSLHNVLLANNLEPTWETKQTG